MGPISFQVPVNAVSLSMDSFKGQASARKASLIAMDVFTFLSENPLLTTGLIAVVTLIIGVGMHRIVRAYLGVKETSWTIATVNTSSGQEIRHSKIDKHI